MSKLQPLHDPSNGILRIIGFMSGSGSNLRKIIEWEHTLKKERAKFIYKVVAIFSDSFNSKANDIGKEFDIPVITRDLKGFYAYRGKHRRDLKVREEFDLETIKALTPFDAKVAAFAGYMSIATQPLIEAYLGINVHPADLSIKLNGKRKYVGAHAVRDALLAGETFLRSTTHIVEHVVDQGCILMISPPLPVLKNSFDPNNLQMINFMEGYYQNRLKEVGDWIIFPKTLQYIAEGRYTQNDQGKLFFDDNECKDKLFEQILKGISYH